MSMLQRIPLHSKEVEIFKPASLADQPECPTFNLKAPTRRQREDMVYAMRQDGLRPYNREEMREATIEELYRLWGCDQSDDGVEKVRGFWQAEDDYIEEATALLVEREAAKDAGEDAPADLEPFEHPDSAMLQDLFERLDESSPRLRRMATGNAKYQRALPRYAIAHCVTGWTRLATPLRLENELLSIDTVFEIEGELEDQFGDLGAAAIHELGAAALGRFFLSKEAEKNSASGPVSQQTPEPTKEAGSASRRGTSPESASSVETPAE